MSWLFDDAYEYRAEARKVLEQVKQARRSLPVRYQRLNETTWIERPLNPKPYTKHLMEQPITRSDAEQAIALYRTAKSAKQQCESQMAEAERIITAFGQSHLEEFTDGRLELDSGTLALRAGAAKPLKEGRPLSAAARVELAGLLPRAYVRPSCDFSSLYGCRDKVVRQLLAARGIEIVREDKFVVL